MLIMVLMSYIKTILPDVNKKWDTHMRTAGQPHFYKLQLYDTFPCWKRLLPTETGFKSHETFENRKLNANSEYNEAFSF